MYHSQHRPKSNRISQLFRCDFPAMRLHGGFDDGQADSGSLHRARVPGYLVKYGDSNTGDVKLWHSKYVSGNKFQINSKAYSLAGASVDYMLYNTYYFQVEPVFGNMDGIASETINAPSNY